MFFRRDFIFYILVAAIPAYIMNRYLMKWIQPKRGLKQFLLYILAVVAIAFLYTLIICWILFKYVWPVK